MARKLFGTDGLRGVAGKEPLSVETALSLGRAVAAGLGGGSTRPLVTVGRDTRLSGDMIESAFVAGLCAEGADVALLGVIPTPAVAWLTSVLGASAGAVISASHNPFHDNGIKVLGGDGFKLSDALEAQIEQRLHGHARREVTGAAVGRLRPVTDPEGRYLEHLLESVPGLRLDGQMVVLDGAHGAGATLGPRLLEALGARVEVLGTAPDGLNINHGVGALHPEGARDRVLELGACLGVALDGDGDRAILVDERGQVRDGDACMAVCGVELLRQGRLPGPLVVTTVMSNLGLERFLQRHGIAMFRAAVGDRYVMEAMREKGARLGGEQSGHLIFLDHATTGDGLLTALQVLQVMFKRGKALSALAEGLERFPQRLVNVLLKERKPLESLPGVQAAVAAAERELGDEGRVNVRFSGTEPLARVMIEGPEESQVERLAQTIAAEIARELA